MTESNFLARVRDKKNGGFALLEQIAESFSAAQNGDTWVEGS